MKPIFLEKAADGPPMLMDGRADALWGAGVGWPAFTALAKQGGRFIGPTPEEIKRILGEEPGAAGGHAAGEELSRARTRRCRSVGSWSYVLADRQAQGRDRLPAGARRASRRSAARRAPRAGARDHDGQHRRRRAAAGAHPPGRAALPARGEARSLAWRSFPARASRYQDSGRRRQQLRQASRGVPARRLGLERACGRTRCRRSPTSATASSAYDRPRRRRRRWTISRRSRSTSASSASTSSAPPPAASSRSTTR